MDELPPELQPRRDEIHNKIARRAAALRRRRAAAIIAAVAIVVAVPTAAIALNAGTSSHGHVRVAASADPTTEPTTTSSTTATTTTIEEATTPPSSTADTTPTSAGPQPGPSSTTILACHNSMNPACGPLHYDQPITNEPATISVVKISPANATVGRAVTFTLRATDPDSQIESSGMWCDDGGYTFGDNNGNQVSCAVACAPSVGYGPWDPPPLHPSALTFTLEHTYNKAGTYKANFKITAELCGPRTSTASTAVEVTIGATTPTS